MSKTEPYIDETGTLVIPFECSDHSYKYWKKEGKSMAEVLSALGANEKTWGQYTHVRPTEKDETAT